MSNGFIAKSPFNNLFKPLSVYHKGMEEKEEPIHEIHEPEQDHKEKEPDHEEKEPWYKSPIRWVLAIFLILIITAWVIPNYAVRLDPNPSRIPSVSEVVPEDITAENKTTNDYLGLLNPNDPMIKRTADRMISLSGCSSNKVCQAKTIFYFIRDNFDYVSDPLKFEYVKSARESLVSHNGDCDDSSVLAANLLQSIGIRTRFVFVPGHVYIEAYLPEALKRYKSDQDWVPLDLTCKQCYFGAVSWQTAGSDKRYIE